MTKRIRGALPVPTMAQRLASMSTAQLMHAARELARKTDAASDRACAAVLEALEARVAGPSFESFVAEIYS
jgi:hypothetical protein